MPGTGKYKDWSLGHATLVCLQNPAKFLQVINHGYWNSWSWMSGKKLFLMIFIIIKVWVVLYQQYNWTILKLHKTEKLLKSTAGRKVKLGKPWAPLSIFSSISADLVHWHFWDLQHQMICFRITLSSNVIQIQDPDKLSSH